MLLPMHLGVERLSKCEQRGGSSYPCEHSHIIFFNWAPSPCTTYSNYQIVGQETKASGLNLSNNLLN